ncbi:hypothetical protein CMV30_08945 [Nibricoccus aquaticus]|uniref:Uncharacterized protein n=1 Tax=Nibricoccus aquaticus TaxID=2576891 RepID=A0A290QFF9_9BACT|nr:hypothetical protein [Nibricoccus aquaticus]ATC64068.1 hypothetical protein CMV30_08945 [Nibricoccus aquaticus]
MPLSTTTLLRFTAKLSRCLSLALLPALASEAHAAVVGQPQRKQNVRAAQPGLVDKRGAVPYLAALAPLPLRFARPGPEPAYEPPTPPEPKPVVAAITPDAKPEKPSEEKPASSSPAANNPTPQPEQPAAPVSEFSEPLLQPPLPILPDDTKRELRAEDVIPFFIYPTAPASGEARVNVIVPLNTSQSQSTPPPSSATYQEK